MLSHASVRCEHVALEGRPRRCDCLMVFEFGHSPERARIVSEQKRRNRRKEKEETLRRPWGSKMLVRFGAIAPVRSRNGP